ncbi:bifunctional folylpolyglutamate synthase/dihydrofolate synthase [Lacticaseibacillus saniviri]
MRTYQETLDYINHLPRLVKRPDHERVLRVLAKLGDPHKKGRYIHITGTNGKGSTASMLSHILSASALRVGLFTSPFIMRFNERLMVDNQPIADDELVLAADVVITAVQTLQAEDADYQLTAFDFETVMAFWYFDHIDVDVAVFEVGIGGRDDSTNVMTPLVSVITEVALDHQKMLGDTLAEIAGHKAGIIKQGVPVVLGPLPDEAQPVVITQAQQLDAPVWQYDQQFATQMLAPIAWGQMFNYRGELGQLKDLAIPLVGDYQVVNASLAITAALLYQQLTKWPIKPREIRQGLAESSWPGRFEKISDEPLIILDGAHNPDGIAHLVTTLKTRFSGTNPQIIAGVLADKAMAPMIAALQQVGTVTLVPVPDTPRSATLADYDALGNTQPSWQEALAMVLEADTDQPIIVTGSLYLVAAVRQTLLGGSDD